MAIVQDAFDIPDDIVTGLATGIYRRIGSVVRYAVGPNKGKIVKHLDPIDLNVAKESCGLGEKTLKFVKKHPKETIIAVVTTASIGAVIWAYNKIRNYEPKIVAEFQSILREYIGAIREGNMDVGKVDKLMTNLKELERHKDYKKIKFQLTTEEMGILVGCICKYTAKLAKDNGIDLIADGLNIAKTESNAAIINLQNCLEVQKRIFDGVA